MKIVCIGDSMTFGYGLKPSEKWVNILNSKGDNQFINRGSNGDTTGGMLARFRRDVLDEKPDMVYIMGGPNDYFMGLGIETVKANYTAMVSAAQTNGILPVVSSHIPQNVGHISERWTSIADIAGSAKKEREILDWFPAFAKSFGIKYIDTFHAFEDAVGERISDYYQEDGLHVNYEGSKVLAEIIAKGLTN